MRVFVTLSDDMIERILRSPPSKKDAVRTLYSDDGIYIINQKVFKMIVDDKPAEFKTIDGIPLVLDPTTRSLQQRWQIPVPHTTCCATVFTYKLNAHLTLVLEKSATTRYYFETDLSHRVVDWIKSNGLSCERAEEEALKERELDS